MYLPTGVEMKGSEFSGNAQYASLHSYFKAQ